VSKKMQSKFTPERTFDLLCFIPTSRYGGDDELSDRLESGAPSLSLSWLLRCLN
jgi:hypothetical protein